jgi:hypothetical protein
MARLHIDKVLIVEDWRTKGHRVYILVQPMPGGERYTLAPDGEIQTIAEGYGTTAGGGSDTEQAPPQPTVTLPEGALDALVAAAQGLQPRSAAVEDALTASVDDARVTRDRLLGLVETLATGTS